MVNGAPDGTEPDADASTDTGIGRSKPPPGSAVSALTGSGEEVEDTAVPVGARSSDWSNAETLDRQG